MEYVMMKVHKLFMQLMLVLILIHIHMLMKMLVYGKLIVKSLILLQQEFMMVDRILSTIKLEQKKLIMFFIQMVCVFSYDQTAEIIDENPAL